MEEAIRKMLRGFRHFRKEHFDDTGLFDELRHGQSPKALVVACSDSRVDPALLTRSAPGDIFVIRNVANLIPAYDPDGRCHGVSAALEYAVRRLHVEHVIVLGHSDCGGIKALMSEERNNGQGEFIHRWLSVAEEARNAVLERLPEASMETRRHACEEAAVTLSLENLMTFPWVRERVESGALKLHGWHFDLAHGCLRFYDAESGEFRLMPDDV